MLPIKTRLGAGKGVALVPRAVVALVWALLGMFVWWGGTGCTATPVEQESRKQIEERRSEIRSWAERCGPSVTKRNCDVGDAMLFDGILCLSGERASCHAVALSQGPDGRMWRAPHRVGTERQDAFSRDMSLGVLAYLVATQDAALGHRWLAWLETNNFRTCVAASDNRCDFTPGFWNLFGEVWAQLGQAPHPQMLTDVVNNEFLLPLQARLSPPGFALHLVGVNLLVRRALRMESALTRVAASTLVERQPENPLFRWLHEGNTPEVVRLALEQCPARPPARRTQWSFERRGEDGAFHDSMGWECVALFNFMLAETK
ncbi:MAG: hypothetical protein IOD12_03295 [Silvanigrellales bacterium]|nr:hypothetical protein [Silvanigrellales bacterium]